jgi:hypothetical protein
LAEIYKIAEEVFVYLGAGARDANLAMNIMRQADDQGSEQGIKYYPGMIDWTLEVEHANAKRGLHDLLNGTWSKRVYVLQEVAYARLVRIFCGSQFASPSSFIEATEAAGIEMKPYCQAVFQNMPKPSQNASWWIPKNSTIAHLLMKSQYSDASVECDKKYALWNMSCDAHDTEYLLPDYEKDSAEVVYETAVFIVGYRGKATRLAVFLHWDWKQLMDNIDKLPHMAVEWAMETQKPDLIKDLLQSLQSYYIPYENWGSTDERTENVLKLAIDTGNLDLTRALL